MILKKPSDFSQEQQQSEDYFIATITWTEDYTFLPSTIAGLSSYNGLHTVLQFLMGLDRSQKKKLGLTEEQIHKTWKSYSCEVTFPNDPHAFGINGNTRHYTW